jgi:uncharacterized protein (UPF0147 family)
MDSRIIEIIELLKELQDDNTVPRNVKSKLSGMQHELESEDGEISLKINKILADVEEIANDINLPMFIRTQIWNLTSMLEGLNCEE